MKVPVVDRAIFERLFGVRRRRAIQLMGFFDGFQAGRTFLVDRLELIRQLGPIEASTEFDREQRRRQRLVDALEDLRRYRAAAGVIIPAEPTSSETSLPDGMLLEAGSLFIRFERAEDLLSKLYAFVQLAARDFDRFRTSIESPRIRCSSGMGARCEPNPSPSG